MRLGILAIVALTLLCACGAATPTVTPTSVPTATRPPVPTLAPAQLTAQAIRAEQQAGQRATASAKQNAACGEIAGYYTNAGRTFDRAQAQRDPETALIDLLIVTGGDGKPALSKLGQYRQDLYRQALWACLGLPPPIVRLP